MHVTGNRLAVTAIHHSPGPNAPSELRTLPFLVVLLFFWKAPPHPQGAQTLRQDIYFLIVVPIHSLCSHEITVTPFQFCLLHFHPLIFLIPFFVHHWQWTVPG